MLCRTPLARHAVRRPAQRPLSAFCAAARRWSGAPAAAAAAPLPPPTSLASPRQPLEHLFRVSDASPAAAASPAVVLRTGYHAAPTDTAAAASAPAAAAASSASYTVTDVSAFEKLMEEALRITPTSAPSRAPSKDAQVSTPEWAASTSTAPTSSTSAGGTLLSNHTVRELQTLLAVTEMALQKPAARKAEVDRYVYNVYLPLLRYGTFALLALQFGVFFNWIFFVFDWNLVEPTTYFIGYTTVFGSLVYHYYRCGEDEFSWRNLFQHLAHREAERMYVKKKVDENQVAVLKRRVAEIRAELARVTV